MLRLFINTLVRSFFQQHAGLFLVGMYVLYGVVEPSQLIGYQKALLLIGVTSPMGMVIVFGAWVLYSLKVLFFVRQKFAESQYGFLRQTAALNMGTQFMLWLKLFLIILLPIGIYVILLIALSFSYHLWWSIVSIVLMFTTLCFALSWFTLRLITFGFLKQERNSLNFGIRAKRPFFSWPVFHVLNGQPLMLLVCKCLSFIFFRGIIWMFADVENDGRVVLIGLLASVLCHAVLIYSLLTFEISYLNFVKSMPVSVLKRIANWMLIFAVILIPEWLSAGVFLPGKAVTFFSALLFSLASFLLMITILYFVRLNMDRYLKCLLFFFFVAIWAILSHHTLPFCLFLLVGCSSCYLKFFNKTDLKALKD